MHAAVLAVLMALSAPVAQAAEATDCAVDINFASYGMGIDAKLHQRMTDALRSDAGVLGAPETAWGREGERRICVLTRGDAETRRTYKRLAGMVPAYSAKAPTAIAALGLHRETRLPRCEGFTWDKLLGRCRRS